MNEETKYVMTLLAFKAMLDKYGVEQVEYDLQRFAEDYEFRIDKRMQVNRFAQPSLDFGNQ